eukprot:COSAG06_NODE_16340_length_1006_cov_1.218302_1_plen_105_part_00
MRTHPRPAAREAQQQGHAVREEPPVVGPRPHNRVMQAHTVLRIERVTAARRAAAAAGFFASARAEAAALGSVHVARLDEEVKLVFFLVVFLFECALLRKRISLF